MARRQRLVIGAAALGMIGTCVVVDPTIMSLGTRQASIALPDGGCEITPPKTSDKPLEQTYAASFPGSGARMIRHLLEGLTETRVASERTHGSKRTDLAIKTHYPHRAGSLLDWDGEINRGLILLRNPKDAIPSFHNFKYEKKNNLINHSTRAPVKDWLEWRTDTVFDVHLAFWEKFVEHWIGRLKPDERIIISYEDITDPTEGPKVSVQLADFFDRVDGVNTISRDSVACVWRKTVSYKEEGANVGSLRSGPKERPYTKRQLQAFLDVLNKLKDKYPNEESLVKILVGYIGDIKNTEPSG